VQGGLRHAEPRRPAAHLGGLVGEARDRARGPDRPGCGRGGELYRQGRPLRFKDVRREFTAESFLLSYALPNFYFHAVTAYDLLRARGLTIGKSDYLGELAVKA
jgi:hypothetical protein